MELVPKKRTFHFVGIGGAGMSGLAEILLRMGYTVQGSDREETALTDYLKSCGAIIKTGHKAEHVAAADVLVYSSAIRPDNPERQAAKQAGIAQMRRAELLGLLMQKKRGIAVAGTHGKTSTTAMIATLLADAGLDPTVLVGGKVQGWGGNARIGNGEFLIAEADEYDRSFLTLYPEICVITSLEADHLDIYKDLQDLRDTFAKFAAQTAFDGLLIRCADDAELAALTVNCACADLFYAVNGSNARIEAQNIQFEKDHSRYDLFVDGKKFCDVKLHVPGTHNVLNSLAAATVGIQVGLSADQVSKGLNAYRGVQRRFEHKGRIGQTLLVDDYAHHPTEVWRTLEAARSAGYKKIAVAFQPHLFSRTRDFYRDFASALAAADRVLLAPIYPAREEPIEGVTSQLIADEIIKGSKTKDVQTIAEKTQLARAIVDAAVGMDLLITMGAGDIWRFGEQALDLNTEKNNA